MRKITAEVLVVFISGVLLAGCASTDTVLKNSQESFSNLLSAYPSLITVTEAQDNYYVLTVDKETLLKISRDYSASEEDVLISTPLQPFVKAGLDVTKLGQGYQSDDASLYLVTDFGKGTGVKTTPTQALFESVTAERKALTYHQELDRYGIALNGGKFEFAKDFQNNDKDLAFVIEAKPLREVGVNVQKIDGWTLTTWKDESGKDVDVLLKSYNLK